MELQSLSLSGDRRTLVLRVPRQTQPETYAITLPLPSPDLDGDGSVGASDIAILLGATVVCMASGRHMYRGVALAAHRERVRVATEQWADASRQAAYDLELARARSAAGTSPGEVAFRTNCAGCHAVDRKLVGPSLREIAGIYAGKPDGIVVWARAPGKKRPDAPQMPPFASVGDATLAAIADYMLTTGGVEKR